MLETLNIFGESELLKRSLRVNITEQICYTYIMKDGTDAMMNLYQQTLRD